MANKTSDAQIRASKKWNEKNKEYRRIRDYRSKGLKFIREFASLEELEDFKTAIIDREEILKNN